MTDMNWVLFKTGGTLFPDSLDLVVGQCCVARVMPVTRFANKLWTVRSLEESLHNKLFHSPGEAAGAVLQLIDWQTGD
jgi:hypothetical protein